MGIIKIKNLSFGYVGKDEVLKNINLDIKKEKITCLLGENGSGKSTLIKCILGLNKGYSGTITIEDKVGYLPQRMNIQTDFPASVNEVVLSGTISNSPRSVFYRKEDKEKAVGIMHELGICEIRDKSFADLSGGQQQRVLIARALCATDKLLILDEPTNGLDVNISAQIYQMLKKLKEELKITILIVSHDVNNVLEIADEVVQMENGVIKHVRNN